MHGHFLDRMVWFETLVWMCVGITGDLVVYITNEKVKCPGTLYCIILHKYAIVTNKCYTWRKSLFRQGNGYEGEEGQHFHLKTQADVPQALFFLKILKIFFFPSIFAEKEGLWVWETEWQNLQSKIGRLTLGISNLSFKSLMLTMPQMKQISYGSSEKALSR